MTMQDYVNEKLGKTVEPKLNDARALYWIWRTMDAEEWSPDTLDEIATILYSAGYEIAEPKDEE
jgi:hypothetical protein